MSLYVHGVWSNISPDKWTFIDKIVRTLCNFSIIWTFVLGAQKNRLIETALLSIKKIVFDMIFKHIQLDT